MSELEEPEPARVRAVVEVGFTLGAERWIERPWYRGASAEEIAALALRDALEGRWGRELVGLTVVAARPGELPVDDPTSGPVGALPSFAVHPGDLAPAEGPALLPDAPGDGVAWYRHESAVGFSGRTGVLLRRCAAVDPAVAEEAAEDLTFHMTHQTSVYPVAAVALPFVVGLLARPEVHPRGALARGLLELFHAARGRRPSAGRLSRAVARLRGSVVGADAERLLGREVEAAAAVRAARGRLSHALRALAEDPVVGPIVAALPPSR